MRKQPQVWMSALRGSVIALGAAATVACSGGTTQSFPSSAAGNAGTTVPLTISKDPNAPAIALELPEVGGYRSSLTVQYASAPADSSLFVRSSLTNPTVIPRLTSVASTVRQKNPTAVEYAVLLSVVITVAVTVVAQGQAVLTEYAPPNTFSSTGSYSLAYQNGSSPNSGWTIISGPVSSTDGRTLTFTATLPPVTFTSGQGFSFAIASSDSY